MSLDRKKLVFLIFDRMDRHREGSVKVADILSCFIGSSQVFAQANINVGVGTNMTQQMLNSFSQGNDLENGVVNWYEFLDYYRGINMTIEDDHAFELCLRNSWNFEGFPLQMPVMNMSVPNRTIHGYTAPDGPNIVGQKYDPFKDKTGTFNYATTANGTENILMIDFFLLLFYSAFKS